LGEFDPFRLLRGLIATEIQIFASDPDISGGDRVLETGKRCLQSGLGAIGIVFR
jgi:hypothetical protein